MNEKHVDLRIEEAKVGIINVINNSNLTLGIAKMILEGVYKEVEMQYQKQMVVLTKPVEEVLHEFIPEDKNTMEKC